MAEVTRRERLRAATELEIRQHAHRLLVQQGQDAVTLRAIARELGITAPALYRYYGSREDLLRRLGKDICTDLATELDGKLDSVGSDDHLTKVFTVCRGFRQWALAHPREFALVFASPTGEIGGDEQIRQDEFGSVFLGILGPLMAEGASLASSEQAPADIGPELATNQEALASAFSHEGIEMPPEALGPDAVHSLLRWWARLYGHVALEVFGRFPFDIRKADRLFESILSELAHEAGLGES
ncbi:TetR family transcriptional regulator [Halopolyspora algeriensis]|uniref:TetR family transcriptional regulator n=1 Tax=Halopolyspora algeriensis TaxID=1500506 RepID=A0A368VZ73_9ACTN|nr:TetR/AcrR family transcriptional regulator [Halopolyspora algeriensis]RCW47205.1 TetR family transcriptional regulator [Halopolyspora algeriensis]TQM48291.1 TetR family transcriptional regulator [Halopolyspora algeriensis]